MTAPDPLPPQPLLDLAPDDHWRADDDGMAQLRADMDRDPLDRPGGVPKTVTVKWRSVRTLLGRLFG